MFNALLDVALGDQTLFIRNDNIDASWTLLEPVLRDFQSSNPVVPLDFYARGSWGPAAAEKFFPNKKNKRTPQGNIKNDT